MVELALTHLDGTTFIAALQEAPVANFTEIDLAARNWAIKRAAVLPKVDGPARCVIYVSNNVQLVARPRLIAGHRLIAGRFLVENRDLWVFAVHGLDRRNFSLESPKRTTFTSSLRTTIRDVTDRQDDTGLIVLGDLNADPWEPEILTGAGLWAVNDPNDLELRDDRVIHAKDTYIAPLFNPMWRCMSEGDTGIRGTFFYPVKGGGPRWHWLDQILVSGDLAQDVGVPDIHASLADRNFLTPAGRPGSRGASDHLPVELELKGA